MLRAVSLPPLSVVLRSSLRRAGPLALLLAGLVLCSVDGLAQQAAKAPTLRYFRQEGGKPVLEAEIVEKTTPEGSKTFHSYTVRSDRVQYLKLTHDKSGKLLAAEVQRRTLGGQTLAQAVHEDGGVRTRGPGGTTEFYSFEGNPIVTSAPDWSDLIQLVRRYDRSKGGRQTFRGLWIHPTQQPLRLTFEIEKVGEDAVSVMGKKMPLDRYRIQLRSGGYDTWADTDRRVVKFMPAGKPDAAATLEGFDEATRELGR